MTITLYARELCSKWGFQDGDILNDFVFDMNLDVYGGDLLCECVEKYLVPLLPHGIKTKRVGSIHNPIRLDDNEFKGMYDPFAELPCWADVYVTLTDEQILSVANEIIAREGSLK